MQNTIYTVQVRDAFTERNHLKVHSVYSDKAKAEAAVEYLRTLAILEGETDPRYSSVIVVPYTVH